MPREGEEVPSEEPYQDRFARIEEAVAAGDADLGGLGFWRLLAKVKLEPGLAHHWADVAGRIDREAFERAVRPLFPVWFGNLVLLLGTLVGAGSIVVAMRAGDPTVAGVALAASGPILSVSLHDLAHWAAGHVSGIRFVHYFIGGPFPPRPGIKTDYATYLRASPEQRALMHASGAIVSKIAPFFSLAFYPASSAPAWAAWALLAFGLLQIVTDVLFSTKSSDWKKVRRERRLARAIIAHRR